MPATTGMSAKPEVPPTHQKVPRRWPRRLYIAITSVLALTALIYFIMPSIARYVAIQMLEKQGMSQVQIKEIHWKPWIPSLTLNSASWQTPASEPVSLASAEITLDWKTLAHKHISITDLDVQALKLPIQIKPYIVIAGFPIQQQSSQEDQEQAPSASNTNPWHISLSKFKVTDTTFTLKGLPAPEEYAQTKMHQLEINTFVISDFSTLSPQDKSNFEFKGKFDDLAFEVNANAALLSEALAVDAHFTLFPADPFIPLKNWLHPSILEGIAGSAALKFKLGIDHRNTVAGRQLEIHLDLSAPSLKTTLTKGMQTPIELELDSLQLISGATLNLAIPVFNIQMNTELKMKGLNLNSNGINANIDQFEAKLQMLDTQGQVTALEQINANLEGSLKMNSLQIDGPNIQPALALSQLQSNGSLKGKSVEIENLSLENLQFLGELTPLTSKIQVSNTMIGRNELGEKSLQISNITMHDLNTSLELTPESKLTIEKKIESFQNQVLAIFPTPSKDESQAPEESVSTKKPAKNLNWEIDHIRLLGENTFRFVDNRAGFGITHAFKIDTLDLKKVGFGQPTLVDFKSTLASGGVITSQGQITLADIQANTALNTSVENIALPPLSSYIVPIIGYSIETGQLDSTMSINTKAGEGTSMVKAQLHKLNLKPADAKIIASLSQELTMPLDLSLSLLKNKNDTIELEIPINLNKEGISTQIAPIIRQSLARATKNASMAYLKYALQPYGSLLLLAEQSQKLMHEMQLINIPFAQMSATLDTDQLGPAQKIAKLLESKPKMKVRLCPTASKTETKDWPTEKESDLVAALKTLALQRAQSVKLFFKKHNISEKRLFICAPKIVQSGLGEVKISL